MKKTILLIMLIGVTASSGLASSTLESRRDQFNINASGMAMKGYDPVSYHEGEPRKGLESITLTHKNIRYSFVTQESRSRFEKDPSRYEPAYGGWCAWAMLAGDQVDLRINASQLDNGVLAGPPSPGFRWRDTVDIS